MSRSKNYETKLDPARTRTILDARQADMKARYKVAADDAKSLESAIRTLCNEYQQPVITFAAYYAVARQMRKAHRKYGGGAPFVEWVTTCIEKAIARGLAWEILGAVCYASTGYWGAPPGVFNLLLPADNAIDVDPDAPRSHTWGAAARVREYTIQRNKDDPTGCPVGFSLVPAFSDTPVLDHDSEYRWNVIASNEWGSTESTDTFSFETTVV